MADSEPPELPRGIALAWGVAATPQRGPKREMSVERIVDAAVELADAEGLAAVSMAAVAAKLGFTTMSLYRYVTAKDDLLLLMLEAASGLPPEEVAEAEGWRARLTLLYEAQVRIYLRHPWMLSLPIAGAPITPNNSAWLDVALAALEDAPLEPSERMAVALGVLGQARWCGTVQAGYTERARATGLSEEEIAVQEHQLYELVITVDEYPALHAAIEQGVIRSEDDPFRFAIDRFFDGVEQYLRARAEGAAPAAPAPWVGLDPVELAADKRHREAQKAVREAEKLLRAARKAERQAHREAAERLSRSRAED